MGSAGMSDSREAEHQGEKNSRVDGALAWAARDG